MFKRRRFGYSYSWVMLVLFGCVLTAGCASRSEPKTAGEVMPRSAASASGAELGAECYDPRTGVTYRDRYGFNDPRFAHCGPDYYVVQERRRALGPGPVLERGSINLPAAPVPLPDNLGILRR